MPSKYGFEDAADREKKRQQGEAEHAAEWEAKREAERQRQVAAQEARKQMRLTAQHVDARVRDVLEDWIQAQTGHDAQATVSVYDDDARWHIEGPRFHMYIPPTYALVTLETDLTLTVDAKTPADTDPATNTGKQEAASELARVLQNATGLKADVQSRGGELLDLGYSRLKGS
jgi:hypothetical protein